MLLSFSDDDAAVEVLNVTGKEQTLRRNIVLGRAKPCPPDEVSPFGMSVSDSVQENSGTFTPVPPVQTCEDTPPQLIDVTAHYGGVTDTSAGRRSENTSAKHASGSGDEETLHSTNISGSANVVKKRARFRPLSRPNENFAVSDSRPYIHESVDSIGSAGVETTETDVSHVKLVIDNLPECLTEEEHHTAVDFIERNADVFSRHEYDVGCTNLLTARLLTDPSQPPIAEPLRRYPRCQLNQIDEAVDKLERARIIEKASSPWAANLFVVQRKSEDGQRVAPRITIDFRKLNFVTYRDKYPIPHIKDCLQALEGAAFLSMADVSNGFYQVPLHEDDRDKTIFITRRRETAYVDSQTSFCPTTNW